MVSDAQALIDSLAKKAGAGFNNLIGNPIGNIFNGINAVINYLKDALNLLSSLVDIFPLQIRFIFLSFTVVAGAYLLYKVARGG